MACLTVLSIERDRSKLLQRTPLCFVFVSGLRACSACSLLEQPVRAVLFACFYVSPGE